MPRLTSRQASPSMPRSASRSPSLSPSQVALVLLIAVLLHVAVAWMIARSGQVIDVAAGPLPSIEVNLLPVPEASAPEVPPAQVKPTVVVPPKPKLKPRPPSAPKATHSRNSEAGESRVARGSPLPPPVAGPMPDGPAAPERSKPIGSSEAPSNAAAGTPAGPATPGAGSTDGAPGGAAAAAPAAPLFGRALLQPSVDGDLQYDLYYGDYTDGQSLARVSLSFSQRDGRYEMRSEARATGLTSVFYSGSLTQSSQGRITQDGVEPDLYSEKRGARPPRSVRIDRDAGMVMYDGKPQPVVPGLQDRLSSLMQLSLLARTQPDRFKPGLLLPVAEMNFSDIETVSYRSEGYVTLPTPLGPLNAIHLVRVRPGKPDEPTIELWLGYDQAMLPVRLRVTDENGRVLDQLLRELPTRSSHPDPNNPTNAAGATGPTDPASAPASNPSTSKE